MRTIGIVGGIAPESTIAYYRQLVARLRERLGDGSYPPIVINSIDMTHMLALIGDGRTAELVAYLTGEVWKLAAAGAEVGLFASNTPHIVFDEVQRESPIPLVSIVDAAAAAAEARGLKRLALLGTRFTMRGRFYPAVFAARQIALVPPYPDEQTYVHDRYMGELVLGVFTPETRAGVLALVERMRERDEIDGVILGGTELPLLLGDTTRAPLPFLDTTQLHVDAMVARALTA